MTSQDPFLSCDSMKETWHACLGVSVEREDWVIVCKTIVTNREHNRASQRHAHSLLPAQFACAVPDLNGNTHWLESQNSLGVNEVKEGQDEFTPLLLFG